MRASLYLVVLVALPALSLTAQTPPAKPEPEPSRTTVRELPVRQVVLYKNGVGYFEHVGSVNGSQRVAIDFTSSQLNDVLQSLTVLDEGGGHIGGVNYNSTTPLGEQLKTLSLGMDDSPTSTELYQALRGQRVEVTGGPGGSVTGRLMSIESRSEKGSTNETVADHFYLTIVANSGSVRVIELTPNLSVRPLDASLQGQLDRYLELLSSNHATGLRHLTLNALGQGQRQLHVSYISEVPVWKSTYRIVFPDSATSGTTAAKAILQGWAVVDNTIGADWDNVQLSLVAGAPQSFIQPLSQPLYLRRPEIPISTTAMTTPQTHEAAEENANNSVSGPPPSPAPVAEAQAVRADRFSGGGGGSNAMALAGVGSGNGMGLGSGGNLGGGVMRIGNAAKNDSFEPDEVSTNAFDDFFQYSLTQPVTIRKNESAMVPILQETLPAEHVTLWSENEQRIPFRAIWLENTSKLTFDSGSFSVFENGAFAGEGLLDPIHPGEKRLVSYATDQAIRVRGSKGESTRVLREIHISTYQGNYAFVQKRYAIQAKRTWITSNSADQPRVVVIELPRRGKRSLSPETHAAETTPTLYRFRVPVPAHQSASLLVADEGVENATLQIKEDMDQVDSLQFLARETPAIASQLEPIITAQQNIKQLTTQLHDLDLASTALTTDEARARENLTALKGNDGARRFVEELNHSEDELDANRKQAADLAEKKKAAIAALRQQLLALDISWTSTTR